MKKKRLVFLFSFGILIIANVLIFILTNSSIYNQEKHFCKKELYLKPIFSTSLIKEAINEITVEASFLTNQDWEVSDSILKTITISEKGKMEKCDKVVELLNTLVISKSNEVLSIMKLRQKLIDNMPDYPTDSRLLEELSVLETVLKQDTPILITVMERDLEDVIINNNFYTIVIFIIFNFFLILLLVTIFYILKKKNFDFLNLFVEDKK